MLARAWNSNLCSASITDIALPRTENQGSTNSAGLLRLGAAPWVAMGNAGPSRLLLHTVCVRSVYDLCVRDRCSLVVCICEQRRARALAGDDHYNHVLLPMCLPLSLNVDWVSLLYGGIAICHLPGDDRSVRRRCAAWFLDWSCYVALAIGRCS
jgi:hypothetical protein